MNETVSTIELVNSKKSQQSAEAKKLNSLYKHIANLERQSDTLLLEIFNNVPDNTIKDFPVPLNLKVYRRGKSRDTISKCSFMYNNKKYYVCEFVFSPLLIFQYVEEEFHILRLNPQIKSSDKDTQIRFL